MKNELAYCLQHHPKVKGFYIFGKILPATWYGSGALLTPYRQTEIMTHITTLYQGPSTFCALLHYILWLLKNVLTLLIPNITLNVFTP